MTDEEMERMLRNLTLQQTLQTLTLKILIARLDETLPEIRLRESLGTLIAETIHHQFPTAKAETADAIEDYIKLVANPPEQRFPWKP